MANSKRQHHDGARAVSRTLAGLNMRPTKGRGQNFMIDQSVVRRIVDVLRPTSGDHVVEVGPGLGILTTELLKRSGSVTAIEIDERLASHLRDEFTEDRFTLVVDDALTAPPESFNPGNQSYLFAANLPYSAGSAIIRRFLELPLPPNRMVVMVQREVAERMTAVPPGMSILGVAVQLYSRASIAFDVPPTAFKPRPKVTSSVVLLEPFAERRLSAADRQAFFELVHAGFHQKRKQLINTLSNGLDLTKPEVDRWLTEAGVSPDQRAETLDVETWLTLHETRPSGD
jgi:16S rRNA (adenine1518-N6/adenine1519-N6)-dimethyltransferase